METQEILQQTRDFYDSAWDKLLWFIGGALALLGIVIPIVIQYYQKQLLKHREAEIKNDIGQQMIKYIDSKFISLEKEIEKNHFHNKGEIWHLQGLHYENIKDFPRAVASYLNSAAFYSKAENATSCLRALDNAFDFLPRCTKEKFKEELDHLIVDLNTTFDIIKSNDSQGAYVDKIAQIKKRINTLT